MLALRPKRAVVEPATASGSGAAAVHGIVDVKSDLLIELAYRRYEADPFGTHWLRQLTAGGIRLQVCATYAVELDLLPELALRRLLEQINAFQRAVRDHAPSVYAVRLRIDLDRAGGPGTIGLMLGMEGTEALGYDPRMIDIFWTLGVRMASITWNRRNPFADGPAEPNDGGLSNLGRALVERMAELGMMIDLAHSSPRTCSEILQNVPNATVLVSHAAAKSMRDLPRNMTDEQMRAIAERGGVFGIMPVAPFIDENNPTIERVIDHIDHAVNVMGIEHVGIGGNFREQIHRSVPSGPMPEILLPEGADRYAQIPGLVGPADWPNLVSAMERRGYRGDRIEAILSANFLRLFRDALPERDPLSA